MACLRRRPDALISRIRAHDRAEARCAPVSWRTRRLRPSGPDQGRHLARERPAPGFDERRSGTPLRRGSGNRLTNTFKPARAALKLGPELIGRSDMDAWIGLVGVIAGALVGLSGQYLMRRTEAHERSK